MFSKSSIPALIGSLILSLFLLAFALPEAFDGIAETHRGQAEVVKLKPQVEKDISSKFIPFTTSAIRIKASGEDFSEGVVNEDEDFYDSVRDTFEKRFGYAYDEAYQNYEEVRHQFDVPEGIKGMVEFWIHVFGHYQKGQYLFHHFDDVSIVYSAINLTDLTPLNSSMSPKELKALRYQYIKEEKNRVKQLLKQLAYKVDKKKELSEEEKRIHNLFLANPNISLKKASESKLIRVQEGFAHRFKEAVIVSGKYMPEMEKIFSMMGAPIELTRIPFFESAFKIRAYSSADAAGIWQFIPATGKRYLKIDSIIDERYDPILATYAAAQHLLNEYKLLGSWPLAVNAYNTGPGRIIDAKKKLKTNDISTIIKNYRGSGYRFYSRNYYPEFLAALHVYENRHYYFADIDVMNPIEYDLYIPKRKINLADLSENLRIDAEAMKILNPALKENILNGDKMLPPGYLVRVPKELGPLFASAAREMYEGSGNSEWHVVKKGEDLKDIAKSYDLSVESIERANQLLPDTVISPGSVLKLPREDELALGDENED